MVGCIPLDSVKNNIFISKIQICNKKRNVDSTQTLTSERAEERVGDNVGESRCREWPGGDMSPGSRYRKNFELLLSSLSKGQ